MRVRPFATASAIALSSLLPAHAVTLYDPGMNSMPSAQGWGMLGLGFPASQSVVGGQYVLDTRSGASIFGNQWLGPGPLNTEAGFVLDFQLQLLEESHTSEHRAGYTVVFVGAQTSRALELSFWTDYVWAQDYVSGSPGDFVHGQEKMWDSKSAMLDYRLSVSNQQSVLSSGSQTLLSGALRDYSAHGYPYNQQSFLFFGDNSSRGVSLSALGLVSLSPIPEPAPQWLLLAGLAGLAWRCRRAAPKA